MSHHPSCRPTDKDLVWYCHQCGEQESAESLVETLARQREALQFSKSFLKAIALLGKVDSREALQIIDATLSQDAPPQGIRRMSEGLPASQSAAEIVVTAWWNKLRFAIHNDPLQATPRALTPEEDYIFANLHVLRNDVAELLVQWKGQDAPQP